MSRKRRREPEELPLFDFPLDHPAAADEPAAEALDDRSPPATPEPEATAEPAATTEPVSSPPPSDPPTVAPETPPPPAAVETAPPAEAAELPFQPSLFASESSAARDPDEGDPVQTDLQMGAPEPDAPLDDGTEASITVGDRLLAGVADIAVHVVMTGIALGAVLGLGVPLTTESWPAFAVLVLAFSFLYWVVPLAFWGQTPGMAWIGHIARGDGDEPLSFGQTVRRWIGAWLTVGLVGLPLLLGLGGRSLSDRLSGTETHGI